jgi:glycosyltransferase involved in cell wall biosynthesis
MVASYHKPVVLQVLPDLVSGGVERGTVDTVKFLTSVGWKSLVASSGGPMVVDVEKAGGKHFSMPLRDKNPLTMLANVFRLALLIKKQKVDILHARSRAPAWSAYLAAKMTGCKFVTTFHGSYSQGLLKNYYNSIMTKGDVVIAVSNFIYNHIKTVYNIPSKKIKIIHRGVDLDEFSVKKVDENRLITLKKKCYIPDDKFVITLPGRLTHWKGHDVLLKAVAQLNNKDVVCLMVGNTKQHVKEFSRLIKLSQSLGLSNRVTFTGTIKDMPALYMLSDLVVAPSTKPEAFGRIAIEAQAMQRPIIVTNIGGYQETIIDGKTGFLVPPNEVNDLAKKISYVMELSEKKKISMGKAARKNVESKFSLKQMKDSIIKIYKQLLGRQV